MWVRALYTLYRHFIHESNQLKFAIVLFFLSDCFFHIFLEVCFPFSSNTSMMSAAVKGGRESWMLMLQKHRSSFSSNVQHSHRIRRNNSQTPHIDFDESIIRIQSKWSIELLLLRQSFTTFRPCLCNGLWWICILFYAVICNVCVSSIFRFAFGSSWLLIFSIPQFFVYQDCILAFFYALKDHSILILYWKS